jgi:hypothetical protein
MAGQKRTKATDTRKPSHSGDASRPSKGTNGQRDAATVSAYIGSNRGST